jgi:hypothetical protein
MKALNLSIIASIIQGFHFEIKVSKEVSRITIEEEDANHEERKESECVEKKTTRRRLRTSRLCFSTINCLRHT